MPRKVKGWEGKGTSVFYDDSSIARPCCLDMWCILHLYSSREEEKLKIWYFFCLGCIIVPAVHRQGCVCFSMPELSYLLQINLVSLLTTPKNIYFLLSLSHVVSSSNITEHSQVYSFLYTFQMLQFSCHSLPILLVSLNSNSLNLPWI